MIVTDIAAGTAAILATCSLNNDQEAFEAVAGTLPPMILVLSDAVTLLRDATLYALTLELGHQADEIDLRFAAGLLITPEVTGQIMEWHDFSGGELAQALPWVAAVLAGSSRLPRDRVALHLAVVISVIASAFAGFPEQWPVFLAAREAAHV